MVHNILYYIVKEILKRTLVRMLICCVIALLFCITGNAKVPYIPKIINYSVSDYKAGNQNWAVSQGPGGKMYIGNNRGLLVFDGIHWDLVKLPNNLGVRALYISKDGRIYVGSFEEFGYFEMDDENDLIYHSLSSSEMNVYLNNDEFWTINEYKGEIYFQSFRSFFIYDGEKVRKGVSDLSPLYIFTLDDHLYVQFMEGGSFCRMDDGQFTELLSKKVLEDDVVSVLPFDHQLLLVSARSGCFIYDEVRKKLSVWNDLTARKSCLSVRIALDRLSFAAYNNSRERCSWGVRQCSGFPHIS